MCLYPSDLYQVRTAPTMGLLGKAENINASGDEQKKLDVLANDIFCAAGESQCGFVLVVWLGTEA